MSHMRFCRASLTRDSDARQIPKTSRATVRRAMTQRTTRPATLATLSQVWRRSYSDFHEMDKLAIALRCCNYLPAAVVFSHNVVSSRSLYAIARPSVSLSSVCLSSVTFVRPTQAVQIFGKGLAIRWHPLKILRRSSQGNPSTGEVKHKRGSKI